MNPVSSLRITVSYVLPWRHFGQFRTVLRIPCFSVEIVRFFMLDILPDCRVIIASIQAILLDTSSLRLIFFKSQILGVIQVLLAHKRWGGGLGPSSFLCTKVV